MGTAYSGKNFLGRSWKNSCFAGKHLATACRWPSTNVIQVPNSANLWKHGFKHQNTEMP
jgi:hypothetical protein